MLLVRATSLPSPKLRAKTGAMVSDTPLTNDDAFSTLNGFRRLSRAIRPCCFRQQQSALTKTGDIEDTLLTLITARAMGGKKFSKLDVKRVYFGNWLRDYSQAVDVGTVKNVSAEAIRLLLWVLGFMSFGYGTGEFEVTSERLGCYRPEEHMSVEPKNHCPYVVLY